MPVLVGTQFNTLSSRPGAGVITEDSVRMLGPGLDSRLLISSSPEVIAFNEMRDGKASKAVLLERCDNVKCMHMATWEKNVI